MRAAKMDQRRDWGIGCGSFRGDTWLASRNRGNCAVAGHDAGICDHGKPDGKCAAMPGLAFDADLALEGSHDRLADAEAQAVASGLGPTRSGLVGSIEPLENARQVLRRDADAAVLDAQPRAAMIGLGAERYVDLSRGGGKLDGVVDEVADYL